MGFWRQTRCVIVLVLAAATASAEDTAWKKSFLLSRAGDAWAKGRLAEAEKLFGNVLALDANDPVALLHLGVAARQRGQLDRAMALLKQGADSHADSFALQAEYGATLVAAKRPKDAIAPLKAATQLNPKRADVLVNLGDALTLAGQRPLAKEPYDAAAELEPKATWVRRQAGVCAFELGQAEEAVVHLTVARQVTPPDANVELVLGHAEAKLGHDDAALEAYRRAAAAAPKNEAGPMFMGLTLEKLGRFDEAKKAFERAIAARPTAAIPRVHLGNFFRARKQVAPARAQYEAAIKVEPRLVWALVQLGFLELEGGAGAKAQKLLARAAALAPGDPEVGVGLGDAYQLMKRPVEARRQYEAVVRRTPSHLAALIRLGDALRATSLDEAVRRYRQAIAHHPRNPWALISLGDAVRQQGHRDEARAMYEAALSVEPTSVWAQRQLGFVRFELGDDDGAWALLSPLANRAPQEVDVLLVVGHLSLRRGGLEEAVGWYGRARALQPNHAPTYVYLAEAARRQGDWPTAEASVRQALALNSASFDAWVLLGDVLRQGGEVTEARRAEARAAYDKALTLLPDDPWAQRQLGTLLADLGETERAERVLTRVKPLFPRDGALRLLLGHLAAKRKSHVQALALYREAMEAAPTTVEPPVFAGRSALALERFDEADVLFRQALDVQPESGWAHLERGYGQRARRDWAGAMVSAEKAVRFEPKNSEAWLFLGRLRHERKDTERALLAYERASELAPTSPYADQALASALANRGRPEDLLRSEALLKRPLAELNHLGFTHAVAGYTYVRLAKTSELTLPAPPKPDSRTARRARWTELGAFELARAVELSPDDRSLRLAASVGLFELGRFDEARRTVTPLLDPGDRICPKEEWTWQWNAKGTPKPPEPADTPEQVQALEDEQLRSEAHLLSGDLFAREAPEKSRLAYFCALQWLPWRADAHLRLAASYEANGLVRLAEQHFVTALSMEPSSAAAKLGLERLRKEGGFPLGPVRVGGLGSFVSEFVPGEVQARQGAVLGFELPALQQSLLTTPRTLTIGANGSWQKPEWRSGLRLGLDYRFAWGFNTFLNDLLTFEDRRSHLIDAYAAGRTASFKDKRFELTWRGGYRLTVANSATRNELRHTFSGSARLLHVEWGFADAELGYELGTFEPTPLAPVADRLAHSVFGGLRATHVIRRYQLEVAGGYRAQVVALVPSARTITVHELTASAQKTWGPWVLLGDLRAGFTTDARAVATGPSAFAASITPRGQFGYAWTGYTRVMGRAGVSIVPGQPRWDSVVVGALGEHRFVFQGFGDADQGLSASLAYDARISYGLGRVEHLVSAIVTLGR